LTHSWNRPAKVVIGFELLSLVAAAAAVVALAGSSSWDAGLLALLMTLSVVSDLLATRIKSEKLKVSGSFIAIVVAMVLLGGAPAAVLGVATMLVGWLRWRERPHFLLNNIVAYATFPLIAGAVFEAVTDGTALAPPSPLYALLVFGVFGLALALNFLMVVGYGAYVERVALREKVETTLVPLLPSQFVAGLLTIGVVYVYIEVGLVATVLVSAGLLAFQQLVARLLESEERAEALEERTRQLAARTRQLATFQVGLLSALVRTLDLRDRMTARHSAAVARYSREIARSAGLPEPSQELVHTAALLHDIGKFIFPDRILKAAVPVEPEDWDIIRCHPLEGARLLEGVAGYGPVAELVLAHHERLDGSGYPHGLKSDETPLLSKIIAIADTYDAMTARDSYRTPMSSDEAIEELRRLAGEKLDAYFVDVFVELLESRDLRYRHGEDADFDAELALEKRVDSYVLSAGVS
jgi:putative nucleotidyltransferase with HDIG domain